MRNIKSIKTILCRGIKRDIRSKSAQVSMEFMVFVGIAVILLAIFTILCIMYINSIYLEREKMMAERLIDNIKDEVSIAGRVNDGYIRMFRIPDNLGGWNYDVYLDKRYVIIRLEEAAEQGEFIGGLNADIENSQPPDNVLKFEIIQGKNTNRDLVIQKENSGVYICTLEGFKEADKNTCVGYTSED